jgi:hypothetical protein
MMDNKRTSRIPSMASPPVVVFRWRRAFTLCTASMKKSTSGAVRQRLLQPVDFVFQLLLSRLRLLSTLLLPAELNILPAV